MSEQRPSLTPCIICEKPVIYLYPEHTKATNLDSGCDITISAHYGSDFDTCQFSGVVCDKCLNNLVESKRLTLVGNITF
jgi:hypothetical protein